MPMLHTIEDIRRNPRRVVLTRQDVIFIRQSLAAGTARKSELAKAFGCSVQNITHIERRVTWRDIPEMATE